MSTPVNLLESDKYYWHRYTGLYEDVLRKMPIRNILEFGVFHGASIRWLREMFPDAHIVGVDIVPPQQEWPLDEGIEYVQLDQGDDAAIRTMFLRLERRFDLILEDGSHQPRHQARVLHWSLPYLRPEGLYILEDIHTSHPLHPYGAQQPKGAATALAVLLALNHLKDTEQPLADELAERLSAEGFFSAQEIKALHRRVGDSYLFRRCTLPLRCYSCGAIDFDYANYRCMCGADLFLGPDSMTYLLKRTAAD